MWVAQRDFLKREAEARQGRDSVLVCAVVLPTKKPEGKCSSFPVSPAVQEEQKVAPQRDSGSQLSVAGGVRV